MNCVCVHGIDRYAAERRDLPSPGRGEVLVRVEVTGLCRTDLKLIRHGHRDLVLPRVPGEEVVGRVAALGPGVSGVSAGDRVYVYPGVWCGECHSCRIGAENLCRGMKIMGFHRDGGFADHVLAPARSLIPVPEGLSPDAAVLAEPLSCCINALELGGVTRGTALAVWGAGPAGILLGRGAGAMGASVTHVEPDPRRRAFVGGCETCPDERFDVCIVAVGSPDAYREALEHLAPRGRLVVFSGLLPEQDRVAVRLNPIHYGEQCLVGAYGCAYRHGEKALDWLASGTVATGDMVSHRMPLGELDRALDLVERRGGLKILLYPDGGTTP
jgi:L-iditol 2-dehydrogenase